MLTAMLLQDRFGLKSLTQKALIVGGAVLSLAFSPLVPLATGLVMWRNGSPMTLEIFKIAALSEAALEASVQVVLQVHTMTLSFFLVNFVSILARRPP